MAKINILDKSVYNLISAGEVVERPASVVKELVENSVDAGADMIFVSLEDGGLTKIEVTDNGCGIDREDMNICYLPHTTSKISKAADLDEISTLGFRGEALASITAVAQVEIASKTADEEVGYRIQISGSNVGECGETGMSTGTKIVVDNLFFNTPVRRKFLKKPKAEESCVTQVMTELIFANPDVKFCYKCDGKVVFDTNKGLENAIFEIFSTEIANKMLPFDKTSGNVRVYGYIGDKTVYKHNRTAQTIIINGRSVDCATIQTAVTQAYGNRLMTRCYPVFVINVIMPFDEVDVNVHPNKKEVRFANSQRIFSCVYHAVEETLAKAETSFLRFDGGNKSENQNDDGLIAADSYGINNISDSNISEREVITNNISQNYVFSDNKEKENINKTYIKSDEKHDEFATQTSLDGLSQIIENQKTLVDSVVNQRGFVDNKALYGVSDNLYSHTPKNIDFKQYNVGLSDDIKDNIVILGQLFDTYLVLQYQQYAYIIDQHACHERYLFDRLKEKIDDGDCCCQPLLVPYILECSAEQYDYVEQISDSLVAIGFEIEEFGGLTFKINTVPAILYDIDLGKFFDQVLSERKIVGNCKQSDLIRDQLAMTACKAAIKAGDKLSNEQIESLLKNMKDGVPMQCPHGRPAVIRLSRTDLDKMFKRIV
ncbi:MAG: DNA mismatch repair endonuclease MutL [Christensenellales bacterium]